MVSAEYLAGFMDGEGYLALGRIPRGPSHEYPVRVVVYNTNREALEQIRQVWGGTLSCSLRKPEWKPQYALIWTNAAGARLLEEVAPHLRIKSKQAEAVLRFHCHTRTYQRNRDLGGRLLPLPEQELEFREEFYKYLKRLNARGPRGLTPGPRKAPQERWRRLSVEYLAGFLDAEGALMIAKWRGQRSWNPGYRARISLANTNRSALEEVRRAFGGILVNSARAKVGWKQCYQLVWTGGMVEKLLSRLFPHLLIKRKQAAVLLDLIRHRKGTRQGRRGPNGRFFAPLPDYIIAYREALYTRMRELNAKGSLSGKGEIGGVSRVSETPIA